MNRLARKQMARKVMETIMPMLLAYEVVISLRSRSNWMALSYQLSGRSMVSELSVTGPPYSFCIITKADIKGAILDVNADLGVR